eukprot:TRINITY_DN110271_c0_g1_i1.p1 TRINITY_DN110271_c0_g1~~TRINITY_DN110271_c0_g1_i1.p1  ORF type:complete len:343 (-),score=58.64 TRINITY_DN110271_c0_g1_i1:162-1190(-)
MLLKTLCAVQTHKIRARIIRSLLVFVFCLWMSGHVFALTPALFLTASFCTSALVVPKSRGHPRIAYMKTKLAAMSPSDARAHKWKSCVVTSNMEETSDALFDDQVVSCFFDMGRQGTALSKHWESLLQHSGGPIFDISVIDAPSDSQQQPWQDRLLAALPSELTKDAGKRALLTATLDQAETLMQVFRSSTQGASRRQNSLRVRLACINKVQCPRLHWDDVPLRAVAILAGEGTVVMPEESVDRSAIRRLGQLSPEEQVELSTDDWNRAFTRSSSHSFLGWFDTGSWQSTALQAPPGCAVFLKGSEWCNANGMRSCSGAIHSSPSSSTLRVVLQVDDASAVL